MPDATSHPVGFEQTSSEQRVALQTIRELAAEYGDQFRFVWWLQTPDDLRVLKLEEGHLQTEYTVARDGVLKVRDVATSTGP